MHLFRCQQKSQNEFDVGCLTDENENGKTKRTALHQTDCPADAGYVDDIPSKAVDIGFLVEKLGDGVLSTEESTGGIYGAEKWSQSCLD